MADFLQCVGKCLDSSFLQNPRNSTLVENKPNGAQQIVLHGGGPKLIYSFDKDDVNLYPYFTKVTGLNCVADYVVFSQSSDGTPFVLVFELKKTKSPVYQLLVTKMFCTFMLDRINRACKTGFNAEIRMIGLVENAKGSTNPRNLKYNDKKILTTSLRSLKLEDLLV